MNPVHRGGATSPSRSAPGPERRRAPRAGLREAARWLPRWAGLPAVVVLAACEPRVPSPGPSVLVLVLDGLVADDLADPTRSPRLWAELAPDAAVVTDAWVDGATTTGPSHAALVTGVRQPLANLPVDLERGAAAYRPATPTLFEAAYADLGAAEDQLLVVANSGFLAQVTTSVHAGAPVGAQWRWIPDPDDPAEPTHDDADVVAAVQDAIRTDAPRLTVVNLHEADRAAHYEDEDDYDAGRATQDTVVADLWRWLNESQPDYAADLLWVVTTDHGRHGHTLDDGWHNHGDACTGCRTAPIWLAGPGVRPGEVDGDGLSQLDLAPTLAAHLGVELPFGEGLPLDALVDVEATPRSGVRELALSENHEAEVHFRDDGTSRTELRLDGEVVSTPGAWSAEGPTLLEAGGVSVLCFRELQLDRAADTQPWTPRCLVDRGTGWTEVGFPAGQVDPWFRPALVLDAGELRVSWAHNPDFTLEDRLDVGISVRSATLDTGGGWTAVDEVEAAVPTGVVRAGGQLAWAASESRDASRYTRRIFVGRVDGAAEVLALPAGEWRAEAPALRRDGDRTQVGFLVHDGAGWRAYGSSTTDGGAWSTPTALPAAGEAILDPAPFWDGPLLTWFETGDGDTRMCRGWLDTSAECISLGSPRVRAAALGPAGVEVVVDEGVGQWVRRAAP